MRRKYLCIPTFRKGDGCGHFSRAVTLTEEIRNIGHEAMIFPDPPVPPDVLSQFPKAGNLILQTQPSAGEWDFVVLDRRMSSAEEIRRYSEWGIPIGLDEGGPYRGGFPFLIDTLPGTAGRNGANIRSTSLISLPRNRKKVRVSTIEKIIITFGGEDPSGLTGKMVGILGEFSHPEYSLTVVRGARFSEILSLPSGVNLLTSPPDLKEMLHEYDLVITSYGFTAFEAAAAGCAVLLWNPTLYHERLSRASGFVSLGYDRQGRSRRTVIGKLRGFLRNPKLPEVFPGTSTGTSSASSFRSLSETISGLIPPRQPACPVCETGFPKPGKKIYRFPDRTFIRCGRCGVIRQLDFSGSVSGYGKEYFFREYQEQYGKTYLEDFEHIKAIGEERLKIIGRIMKRLNPSVKNPVLMDVGCAYGPFLEKAREEGFSPFGLDVCRDAIDYLKNQLSIPGIAASFEEISLKNFSFDAFPPAPEPAGAVWGIPENGSVSVLSMWFVLEHFSSISQRIRQVNDLLVPGGIFALSMPSFAGISGKSNLIEYLLNSPKDHTLIFNIPGAAGMLRRHGFSVAAVRCTGHHPERFPGVSEASPRIVKKFCLLLSRILRLGDTFEIYGVKG